MPIITQHNTMQNMAVVVVIFVVVIVVVIVIIILQRDKIRKWNC